MNEKTKADYRRLAANFYATRLNGQPPSPKRLQDALRASAPEYRPAYWRRLRNAIEFDQREKKFSEAANRIASTQNPITNPASNAERVRYEAVEVKSKQRRAKGITPADANKLEQHFHDAGDLTSERVLVICRALGCRPAEISGVRVHPDGTVKIPGAKGRADRGIPERTITIDPITTNRVLDALRHLHLESGGRMAPVVAKVQDRVARGARKLWPRRKAHPSLYSYRHQMGSDLKASGMDPVRVAYVMGHRSTESVEVYGDRRKASGGRTPLPAPGADLSQVIVNHKERPAKQRQAAPVVQKRSFDSEGPGM